MKASFKKCLNLFVSSQWLFYGVIAIVGAPVFINDWNVMGTLARLDARYDGWFIDELVIFAVILVVAAALRRAALLRREVCRRQEAEATAELLARHDPLTGLPNRRLLQEAMTASIDSLGPNNTFAAMIVDLDGFKAGNDLHGHPVGDALLCRVVERLSALVPDGSTLARLGGDEFGLLLSRNMPREDVTRTADLIVTTLGESFQLTGKNIEIGASVGIAFAPTDGETMPDLMRADAALSRAKQAGRGTSRFFEPGMDDAMREQTTLKAELRNALITGQIVPFYQPTVNLSTGKVDGLEVLARWLHPSRGLIGPDKFIPLAEDIRLMSLLTLSLFEQVCRDAKRWPGHCRIAINVSPSQLRDPGVAMHLATLIAEAGLRPSRFEIEITETALINDVETAREVINGLRAMGLTVALDDFGTGSSSLYHLRELTFDKVKIDKSFVQDISTSPTAARYVEAIIRLVTSLDLKVTAEGIEENDVLVRLTDMGCTSGQGYIFSRPIPASDVRLETQLALASITASSIQGSQMR